MKPTKIYIGAKQAAELEKNSEGRHTMTVKTFPSKNDVEYTDVSQLWKTFNDVPIAGGWLLCKLAEAEKKYMTLYVSPLETIEQMGQWTEYAFEKGITMYISIDDIPPLI